MTSDPSGASTIVPGFKFLVPVLIGVNLIRGIEPGQVLHQKPASV